MIDTVLNIFENLVKLAQIKADMNQNIFKNHIDPIYQDLRIVFDDYHSTLKSTKENIKDENISNYDIFIMLYERREKHERTRDEIKKYAKALTASNFNADIKKFATSTVELLSVEPLTTEKIKYPVKPNISQSQTNEKSEIRFTNASTASSSLILDLRRLLDSDKSRKSALSLIRYYTKEIDKRWDDVSQNYFELRTKYLK